MTAAIAAAVTAPTARADGDPASDYLLGQNVFYPGPPPSQSLQTSLERAVAGVYANGDRLKVALIASANDLGAIPSLFGRPSEYAHFLGIELGLWYVGPLLVVMPAGVGVYDGGRTTAREEQALQSLSVSAESADDLARAAIDALQRLVAAHALGSPDVRAPLVTAYPASARRGTTASMHVDVFDDSGRATVRVRVYDERSLLATLNAPARFTIGTRAVRVRWRVPAELRNRHLRFCAVAADPAGNRSAPACAAFLEVR